MTLGGSLASDGVSAADFATMQQCIVDGAPERARELATEALAAGVDPVDVLNLGFLAGMREVGAQYGQGRMFLPDMMASSEAMRAAVAVLDPAFRARGAERPAEGKVVLGTTKGDIHEIGKSLVATLLSANGFRVFDLGVDVPAEQFVAKAREVEADIIGVSALLTTTMQGQRHVVEALQHAGLRPRVKILIGGAPVTRRWAEEIGADGFGKDAFSAVTLARELLGLPATKADG